MGPRIREDNGGDGRFANRAYGLLTTRASAAWGQSIFIAITGEGAHEGRPYGGWGAWRKRPKRLVSWRGLGFATAKRPVECR